MRWICGQKDSCCYSKSPGVTVPQVTSSSNDDAVYTLMKLQQGFLSRHQTCRVFGTACAEQVENRGHLEKLVPCLLQKSTTTFESVKNTCTFSWCRAEKAAGKINFVCCESP